MKCSNGSCDDDGDDDYCVDEHLSYLHSSYMLY